MCYYSCDNGELGARKKLLADIVLHRKDVMLAAMKMLRKQYGGAEKYFLDVCGLDNTHVAGLRRNLTNNVSKDELGPAALL